MSSIAAFWDAAAATFDEEADHGLRDPAVSAAWAARLRSWLPPLPVDVLDLGCGTGSLTLLLAGQGHRPVGVDLSPRMVALARTKLTAAGFEAGVVVGDAADPPVAGPFDVILARHLLWTLPDPEAALRHWVTLLRPGGRLVLIEGRWATGGDYVESGFPWSGGVEADRLVPALPPGLADVWVDPLADPALWGRSVDGERYAVIALAPPD
ncbi:class I SAM-dependent methyltransferase [Nonomuraea sp. NPDC050328]|uniref:class I SAM-dependent methyltransferase n=1 Tax=Nonomuraea sp. NPDC050328 TaxID=3364361 RepID=UPI0037A7B97B